MSEERYVPPNHYQPLSEPFPIPGIRARGVGESLVTDTVGTVKGHMTLATRLLLIISMVTGALTHGYHLFVYPLYITDEGIYMEQAWSILREGRMSPYTYFYDHAPAGWIVIAGWVSLLPHQFEAFGDAINTGRVLMLIAHIASIYLLFQVTYRLSHSALAAFLAAFLFNFSPLAVYYQRQVYLDNLMVFWVLLSLYLITSNDGRVITLLLSGLAFGIGVLTKENAIFFAPAFGYLLYTQVRHWPNFRFGLGFWMYAALATISLYFLFATLKNELLPSHLSFNLNNPPADHVSLLYSIWWQLHRSQGSIMDLNSYFWVIMKVWLSKDTFILIGGMVAVAINLLFGLQERKKNQSFLVASLLATGYAFYIARGSQMLEFYIVPLIPFLSMNLGMLLNRCVVALKEGSGKTFSLVTQWVVALSFMAALVSPVGGYFLDHDEFGKVVPHDLYKLPQTYMQQEELAYVREHIPPTARIIMDDELWVDLHDGTPSYKYAHSHWKAASDPDIRDKLFHRDWNNIDYIVMSNKMVDAMELNNGDGSETWILDALQHATRIWDLKRGDVELQIYQIQH
ncbi:MAG TPA: glycosyltransferase family 39 protein [Ktedonobacterales bacterium]